MILVDSNVLIDIIDEDSQWFDWSFANLENAARLGRVFVNAPVVAEVAPRFGGLKPFLDAISVMLVHAEPLSIEAAYLAGTAFQAYREKKQAGQPKAILADFLIGGHAQAAQASILTRDPRFYRSYFPEVQLITPESST